MRAVYGGLRYWKVLLECTLFWKVLKYTAKEKVIQTALFFFFKRTLGLMYNTFVKALYFFGINKEVT